MPMDTYFIGGYQCLLMFILVIIIGDNFINGD
jgi:hypothetical protein